MKISSSRIVFIAFVALYVALLWSARYVPTQDGPSHLANAAALRDILLPGDQVIEAYYEVERRPVPNWIYYAVMAPLMALLPPLVAEKIFLSAYVIAFAFACYKLARAAGVRTWAPAAAALPFAVGLPFQMGFFNYCVGVVVMLAALAYFWPRRDRPGVREAVVLNLFAVAAYFCHLLPTLLLLGTLFFLNVVLAAGIVPGKRSWGRRALFLVGLLPAWVLPIYYLSQPTGGALEWFPPADLLRLILSGWPLVSFSSAQRVAGVFAVVAALTAVAAVAVAKRAGRRPRREPRDAFGLVAGVFLVLCFAAPDAAGGGSWVSCRLAALVLVFTFIWAGDGLGRRGDVAALVVAATLAVGAWAGNLYYYRKYDPVLRELTAADCGFRPGAGMVYFDYSEKRPGRVCPTFHAGAYYAARWRLLNFCNYEAEIPYFPVRFRPVALRPRAVEIVEGYRYDTGECLPIVDYIILWDTNPFHRKRLAAERWYDVVSRSPRLEVLAKKAAYREAGRE